MSVSSGVDGRGQEGDEFHQFGFDYQHGFDQESPLSSVLIECRNN
jgi:hypothetical protein